MKTALIYSGQARTFSQIWENHRWYLRHLPNPEIFAFVADDAQADDMLLLKQSFPGRRFEFGKGAQPDIPEPEELTRFRSGYPRSTSLQGVLKQLFALNAAWDFFCERANPQDYDLIVRVRPDIAFCRLVVPWAHFHPDNRQPENLARALDYDLRRHAGIPLRNVCWTPNWAKWGGVNDRFAIMGHAAAPHYFTTFEKRERLWDMGCPRHPEQMVAASLEDGGIVPDSTCAFDFVTVRLPSAQHPKGGYYPIDCSSLDVADMARELSR